MEKRLKNALIFFIISFVWTWAFYFSIVLFGLDPYQGIGMVLLICGGCSPTFAGIIMVLATGKKARILDFARRVYQARRIKLIWWLFIIFIFPIVFAAGIGLDLMLGGTLPEMINLKAIIASPLSWFPLVLLSFMSGPFSEEMGWRGFALDPLLNRFGFTRASVLLGLIWGAWHLPLYLMPQTWHGQMGFQFTGFWLFILMSIGLSAMMSWVYVNTKRSILSAMLMHLGSNFTGQLLADVSLNLELIRSLLILAAGIVICIHMILAKKDAAIHYQISEEVQASNPV